MTPGEHFFGDRQAGFQVRDTVLVLLPGPRLLTLMLLRTPLDGTVAETVLKHGCGGINIDGCRVGTTTRLNAASSGHHGYVAAVERGRFWKGVESQVLNHGRWPTNLILVHGPGCRQVGSRRVRGSALHQEIARSASKSDTYQRGKHQTDGFCTGFTDPDGTEEVPDWTCQHDCPVRLLDEQAGVHPGMSSGGTHSEDYGGGLFGVTDSASTARGDTGTVSRFFPQFQSLADAVTWLGQLTGRPGDPRRVGP